MSNQLPTPFDPRQIGDALVAAPNPGRYAPAPAGDDEDRMDWGRYVAAILRYKWLILGVVALGTVAGVVATRMLKPTYAAQANIWVPATPAGGSQAGPMQPAQLFSSAGWIELIKTSFVVLDDVVRDLRLYLQVGSVEDSAAFVGFGLAGAFVPGDYVLETSADGRRFVLRTAQGVVRDQGGAGDSIGEGLGFAWAPSPNVLGSGRDIKFSLAPPRDVAVWLQEQLQVRLNELGANFLAVRLEGQDPELLAATVNRVAAGFVDTARSLSITKHRELLRALSIQLDSAGRRLHDAEVAREQFRVDTYTQPRERASPLSPGLEGTTNPALDNYSTMKFELDGLERDREAIERALTSAGTGGVASDALLYVGTVQGSAELLAVLNELTTRQTALTALRLQYTEEYPEVQRATSAIRELQGQTIPRLARGLLDQIRAREAELESRIASAGRELQQIPRRSTEEQRLEREVEITGFAYQRLKQQYQDALLARSAEDLGARLLDPAVVPRSPVREVAIRLMIMVVAASVGLAVVLALLLDRVDRRVRYPEQVSSQLGLPILGAIPRVKTKVNGRAMAAQDTMQVVEALRGVRLGLSHAHGTAGPLVVTVTSPGPGEGKSFVVSNLALTFADAGHRTIVIDADVRRGELHRTLGGVRKPGLTDYLSGHVESVAVQQRTQYDRLAFIGAGTRMHHGPELLGSSALQRLLLDLRGTYDVILLDSPPLAAGIDPLLVGVASGNLLLVLRPGVTDRELAEAKLDMLDRMPIRVLGAVLNDVHTGGRYRYYSYQYYVEGYETRDENGASAPAALAGGQAERPSE